MLETRYFVPIFLALMKMRRSRLRAMNRRQANFSRQSGRLQVYLESLTRTAGHADRVSPIGNYTKGLLLPLGVCRE